MAPPTWTDDAQTAWLRGWMDNFMRRQGEGKLHLFWPGLYEAWFHKWPQERALQLPIPSDANARTLTDIELLLLGVAIKTKKTQLENWFRNQRKKIGNASTPASQTRSTSALFRNIFKINAPRRRRAHKPIEQFQTRNVALIDDALKEAGYNELTLENLGEMDWTNEAAGTEGACNKALKSMRMRMRTRVVTALWVEADDTEIEAVEADVEAERVEIREAELKAEEDLDPSVPNACTVWELQDGIDALEPVFAEVHKATHNAAGWVGMTIVGGPNPRLGGEFSYKIICFGETPAGNDFEDSCVDFDKNVTEPFEEYLRAVFTAQEQRARALPSRPEPESSARGASRAAEGDVEEPSPPADMVPVKKRKRVRKLKKNSAGAAIAPLAIAPVAPALVLGSVAVIPSTAPVSTPPSTAPTSPFLTPAVAVSADDPSGIDAFSLAHLFDGFDFDAMTLELPSSSSPIPSSPASLSPPSSPSASAAPVAPFTLRPIPRPSYKGAAYAPLGALETTNVGGYNFPLESPPPGSLPAASACGPSTFTSMAARAVYGIITQPTPPKTTPVIAPTTTPGARTPVIAPVMTPTTAVIAPTTVGMSTPTVSPIVTATNITLDGVDEVDEFPRSRPPAKVPTVQKWAAGMDATMKGTAKDTAAVKKVGRVAVKKTAQPKAGTVAAEKQQAAVTMAQKVVGVEEKAKRGRGRPRKIVAEGVVAEGNAEVEDVLEGGAWRSERGADDLYINIGKKAQGTERAGGGRGAQRAGVCTRQGYAKGRGGGPGAQGAGTQRARGGNAACKGRERSAQRAGMRHAKEGGAERQGCGGAIARQWMGMEERTGAGPRGAPSGAGKRELQRGKEEAGILTCVNNVRIWMSGAPPSVAGERGCSRSGKSEGGAPRENQLILRNACLGEKDTELIYQGPPLAVDPDISINRSFTGNNAWNLTTCCCCCVDLNLEKRMTDCGAPHLEDSHQKLSALPMMMSTKWPPKIMQKSSIGGSGYRIHLVQFYSKVFMPFSGVASVSPHSTTAEEQGAGPKYRVHGAASLAMLLSPLRVIEWLWVAPSGTPRAYRDTLPNARAPHRRLAAATRVADAVERWTEDKVAVQGREYGGDEWYMEPGVLRCRVAVEHRFLHGGEVPTA
ncbi:hypothetical protein C8R44DRAFT_736575 [Mycena epipterygia]|nr:hypothetical protein C8R44DRAFT_736575 [Mycena epipterygia]